MKFKNLVNNILCESNLFKKEYHYFAEGIQEVAKQFPKIPEEKLKELIALDPTYKGGDQLGKYGKWIIRLFYNNFRNAERMANYKEFMAKNNGINPKTNQPIEKPELLPSTPWEDADKLPSLLKQYNVLKNQIGKPLDYFNTIPELYTAVQQHKERGVPTDEKAFERYNVFKECEPKGLEKIYENDKWVIGIPTTFESSKPFGEYTNWCTTSHGGTYYNSYLKDYGGEYYIILNKEDGSLYQFHFESKQFMDERDNRISMDEFTDKCPDVAKFLYEYKFKKYPIDKELDGEIRKVTKYNNLVDKFENVKQKFNTCLQNPKLLGKEVFYHHYVNSDKLTIEDDKVIGIMDIDNLGNEIYNNGARDCISNETMCEILTYNTDWDYYYEDDINNWNSCESDWNKVAEKYGIKDRYNWDKIVDIYTGLHNDVPEEVVNLVQDDFYDGIGILHFLLDCKRYGTEQEAHGDVLEKVEEEIPITGREIYEESNGYSAEFSVSKDDLFKILFMIETGVYEDVPSYDKEMKKKELPNKNPLEIPPMTDQWWLNWYDDNEYNDASGYDNEDWLYLWRVLNGKCEADDGEYGAFAISEPYYGWDGFDDKLMEEGFELAAKEIAKIVNGEQQKVVGES